MINDRNKSTRRPADTQPPSVQSLLHERKDTNFKLQLNQKMLANLECFIRKRSSTKGPHADRQKSSLNKTVGSGLLDRLRQPIKEKLNTEVLPKQQSSSMINNNNNSNISTRNVCTQRLSTVAEPRKLPVSTKESYKNEDSSNSPDLANSAMRSVIESIEKKREIAKETGYQRQESQEEQPRSPVPQFLNKQGEDPLNPNFWMSKLLVIKEDDKSHISTEETLLSERAYYQQQFSSSKAQFFSSSKTQFMELTRKVQYRSSFNAETNYPGFLSARQDTVELSNNKLKPSPSYALAPILRGGPNSQNQPINYDNILQDGRTTVMIRNIPTKYTREMLETQMDRQFANCYDFLYLPFDFKVEKPRNVGYAFINFLKVDSIRSFYVVFSGRRWPRSNSVKICELCYASWQGREELEKRFKDSKVLTQKEKCYRPIIKEEKTMTELLRQQRQRTGNNNNNNKHK